MTRYFERFPIAMMTPRSIRTVTAFRGSRYESQKARTYATGLEPRFSMRGKIERNGSEYGSPVGLGVAVRTGGAPSALGTARLAVP